MFIPDPDFLSIPYSEPNNIKKRRGGGNSCTTFFVATNVTELKIILFYTGKDKYLSQLTKSYDTFYQENCHQALKNMRLGSGIPESGGQKGSRIPDLDPQHWIFLNSDRGLGKKLTESSSVEPQLASYCRSSLELAPSFL